MSVLVDLAGMTEEQVAELRSSAVWPERLATAPTIAREAKIEDTWKFQQGQFEAISAPTVFVVGSQNPPDLVEITQKLATGVSGAQVHTLADRDHFAYKTHPSEVANVIRTFVRSAS